MSLALCYSPLSPFCRKVRMAMDYKQLTFRVVETDRLEDLPVWSPRAEVPVLVHGETVVCNSPDILAYLDRAYPELPVYPADARRYAEVRAWERVADTELDAVVSVVGTWSFADLSPMPPGLMDAARRDFAVLCDRLEAQLAGGEFLCGALGAADFAAYPHVAAARVLGLAPAPELHPGLKRWMRTLRGRPEGQIDHAAVREWWADRAAHEVETRRVNWGTFRLEWLLANGHAGWFAREVERGAVIWSTGPASNARNSPLAPGWAQGG